MKSNRLLFEELSAWHQNMISCLLKHSFPGIQEISHQIESASFEIIDKNKSLGVFPSISIAAPVIKTIPIEARAVDTDGVPIEVLLFTRKGFVCMLEILRGDGEKVENLPEVDQFEVILLGS